jgi:hypothetical protein
MSFGSKKEPRNTIIFYPNSPDKQIPTRFPNEAHMERDACLQDIFTCLLMCFFTSKAPWKDRDSMVPKSGVPMETDAHANALLKIFWRSPVKVPSPGAHRTEPVQRETLRS